MVKKKANKKRKKPYRKVILVPIPLYEEFTKRKGALIAKEGRNYSNQKFLRYSLDRVKV